MTTDDAPRHSTGRYHSFHTALVLLLVVGSMRAAQATHSAAPSSGEKVEPPLSESANAVRSLLGDRRLSDLRRPDFSDFSQHVGNFYRASNYSLAWIQDSNVKARAREMIEVLASADGEGLNAEDYDGPRWPGRIAHLQSAHSRQDEARFDVALTVCSMRYISAVRIGRINPKHLKFGFDVEHKKLDLAGYLAELLSSSSDLRGELAEIEPPFSGYRATRRALLKFEELAKQDDGETLPPSIGTVYMGGYYDHMPSLARRLRQLGEMRVNVGDAYDFQTPVFQNSIRYLVFRPYWNVPPAF